MKNDNFNTTVIHVAQINDQIRHYVGSPNNEISSGSKVYCLVDQNGRLLNARYHTAEHLLGNGGNYLSKIKSY